MPSASYSFLDVAVLDDVRERFASGDALVILSTDLEDVIWANGPGAALFGQPDIEAIIGASAQLAFATKRQIAATRGFPDIGRDRAILVRLTTGMSSRAVALLASAVTLPDGETAILLAAPAATGGARSDRDIAERAIGGFAEAGHFVAFVDKQGAIEAASDGFEALGITAETLAGMVEKVGGEGSRIVKRMIPGQAGPLPAGLARLTDARHLLVVIDEGRTGEEATAKPDAAAPEAASVVEVDDAVSHIAPNVDDSVATSEVESAASPENEEPPAEAAQAGHDGWYFSAEDGDSAEEEMLLEAEAAAEQLQHGEPATAAEQPQPEAPEAEELEIVEPHEPVSATEPEAAPDEPEAEIPVAAVPTGKAPIAPEIDRASGPVRFVWRTDAEGKFSHISPEFSRAVGAEAADIVGRRFEDVANVLGLDPAGEIAGLLARRDTWSGRSVLWPVAGTDLKIPVDLAALPVYDRARTFEGFRGFGVARTGDAVVDPEGIGLVLVTAPAEAAPDVPDTETPKEEAANDVAEKPADPFRGEVPALTIVPAQERRFTDKVIRLAEHRQPPANDKGLSAGERIAFQQIGERLKKDSGGAAPEAGETGEAAPQKKDAAQPDQAEAAVSAEAAAANVVDVTEAAATADPDETVGDADDVSELLMLDGESGEASAANDAKGEETTTASIEETAPETVDEAKPSESPEVTAEVDAPAADEVAAESATKPEAVAPARKPGRPGMSLLDFAKWDQDEPAQTPDTGHATAAEPVVAEPTAEPVAAAADPASAPVALVEMEEAAALDERTPQAVEDDRAGEGTAIDANPIAEAESPPAGQQPDTPPAEEQVETAPEAPDASGVVSRAFIERRRPDITQQRREEDAASPSADLQQKAGTGLSILEKLPVPVLVHAGDTLHYANHEFFALTGYRSVEELSDAGGIGALFADPYEDEDAPDKVDRQLRLKNRDGEEFPVEAFLQSVPWNGGKALLLVLSRAREGAFATASSGQSPLIAELETRVAEMRTIIDTATDGVVLIARDGAIRSISRPAEALFGFDSDEVTGKPFASLFAIESQRAARDYLNGLSDHGVASVLNDGREVIGRESQGRFIPLFMTIGKLPNDSGYCAVVRDITQWKRAEEELTQARSLAERASSHKTDFLARVSHEIRTPLNAIIGFSELMMDERFGPVANDRYRDYLRDINRSGNHVLDLVNDLLDISKIEAGQQEMAYEAVSLNDALSETVAMMQPQANRERVIIRSSFASKLPDVVADLRSVRQIALNVLSNAVRYTQAGGQVIVSTAYEAGEVVMRVRDTGIGMTPAEIEQALKPFKQINSLKRARGDGTGLGLPLTKAMVEANRAKFSINSTPGEGTLVEISFPSTRVLAD